MPVTVLNVLPHRGGGGETFIDCLEGLEGFVQLRRPLSTTRSPLAAGPSILAHWPGIASASRHADLLQTHGDVASMLSLPLMRGRPSVAVSHGLHLLRRADGTALRVARRGMGAVIATADRTVCNSDTERDELARLVVPRLHERLVVVNNTAPPPTGPPPPGRTEARAALGLDPDGVVALYVAQLEERKDPLTAIGAVHRARERGAPLTLLLAGDGPLREQAQAQAGGGVEVLGHRNDLPRLMAAADIFVLPSLREGQSIALLEAMRAGLAIVVSDGAGNAETVGDAGVVFRVGDAGGLAAALASLAGDEGERRRLGTAAFERFGACFAPELFLERMRAVYTDVLAGAGLRGAPTE